MGTPPFLPGLILALVVWILSLTVRYLPGRILSAIAGRAPWLPGWTPWIRSVLLPYIGLLAGWISSRDFGLVGHTPVEWLIGAAAAVVLGIILGRMSIRFSAAFGWGVVGDEVRWTLYRAAAWPWAGFLPLAIAAALVAACAEFAWERKLGGEKLFDEVGGLFLAHAACSAALFLLAHNFFLAMLMYLTAVIASTPDIRLRVTELWARLRKQ
jgi:hypothetical protein